MENLLAGHLAKTHLSQLSDTTWEVPESRRESSMLVSDSHQGILLNCVLCLMTPFALDFCCRLKFPSLY